MKNLFLCIQLSITLFGINCLWSINAAQTQQNLTIRKMVQQTQEKKHKSEEYASQASNFSKKGDYNRAIENYTRAIELNPSYSDAYCNRGVMWAKMGFYDKAIEDYTKAIDLNPQDNIAYGNRGNVYSNNKIDFDHAIKDYTEAIEIDPTGYLYFAKGVVWLKKKNYERAITDLRKAIALNRKDSYVYDDLGLALKKKG